MRSQVQFGTERPRGALPAEFPDPAWGTIVAGMSDLAWAAEPAMQRFWLHVKSSVSLTGLEPITQLGDAAFFPARVGAAKGHWCKSMSPQLLHRTWLHRNIDIAGRNGLT